eukprot:3968757-Amphidinium_carterae.1
MPQVSKHEAASVRSISPTLLFHVLDAFAYLREEVIIQHFHTSRKPSCLRVTPSPEPVEFRIERWTRP